MKVEFLFNETWYDYTNIVKHFTIQKREMLYDNKLSPSTSDYTFFVSPNTVFFNQIKTNNTKNIECKITKDDLPFFRGYVKPDNKFSIADKRQSDVKIEVVSGSYLLNKNVGSRIHLVNQSVRDIVIYLLNQAGFTSCSIHNINTIIPVINIEENKSKYHEIITNILFQYGYTFFFDKDNKFTTYELFPTTITPTINITDSSYTSISQSIVEEEIEKIKVKWNSVISKSDIIVYSNVDKPGDGNKCNVEIQANSYLGNDSGYYVDFSSDYGTILDCSNVRLDILKDSEIVVEELSFTPTRAFLKIKNNASTVKKIYKLDFIADAIIISTENITIGTYNNDTDKIKEISSEYIFDETTASKLSDGLKNYYEYNDFTYIVRMNQECNIGDYVNINVTDIGSNIGRIIRKSINYRENIFEYEIEALNEYTPSTTTTEVTVLQPRPTTENPLNNQIENISSSIKISDSGILGKSYTGSPTVLDTRTLFNENGIQIQALMSSNTIGTITDITNFNNLNNGVANFTNSLNNMIYYDGCYYLSQCESYSANNSNRVLINKYKFNDEARYVLDKTLIVSDFHVYNLEDASKNTDFKNLNNGTGLLFTYNPNPDLPLNIYLIDLVNMVVLDSIDGRMSSQDAILIGNSFSIVLDSNKIIYGISGGSNFTFNLRTITITANELSLSDILTLNTTTYSTYCGYCKLTSSKILATIKINDVFVNHVIGLDVNNKPEVLATSSFSVVNVQEYINDNGKIIYITYDSTTKYGVLSFDDGTNTITELKAITAFPTNNLTLASNNKACKMFSYDAGTFYLTLKEQNSTTLRFAKYSIDGSGTISYVGEPNNLTLTDCADFQVEVNNENQDCLMIHYYTTTGSEVLIRLGFNAYWNTVSSMSTNGEIIAPTIKPNGSSYIARGINISTSLPTSNDGIDGDIWIKV